MSHCTVTRGRGMANSGVQAVCSLCHSIQNVPLHCYNSGVQAVCSLCHSSLSKMSHCTVITVECKPYVVYVTLACILYLAPKRGYRAVEYSAVAEYR